ncbi:MAG: hypothetical protein R2779_02155 [Crocinitomicaceae bacterium]
MTINVNTSIPKKKLLELGKKIASLQKENVFRKIQKIFSDRFEAITTDQLD